MAANSGYGLMSAPWPSALQVYVIVVCPPNGPCWVMCVSFRVVKTYCSNRKRRVCYDTVTWGRYSDRKTALSCSPSLLGDLQDRAAVPACLEAESWYR